MSTSNPGHGAKPSDGVSKSSDSNAERPASSSLAGGAGGSPARGLRAILSFSGRLVALALAVFVCGGLWPWIDPTSSAPYWAQVALLCGIVFTLVIYYRGFLPDLLRYLVEHPGQATILALLVAMLYGLIGTSYGIPELFWNEYPLTRILAATAATLLLAVLGINAYYLDRKALRNSKRFKRFLADFGARYRLDFLRPIEAEARPPRSRLDPTRNNPRRVSRFLRVARLPFLVILSLPALFPLVFPYVPRVAPFGTAMVGIVPDVGRQPIAWLLGLGCWLAGLLAGILVVKIGLLVADRAATVDLSKHLGWMPNPRLGPIPWAILALAVIASFLDATYGFATQKGGIAAWLLFFLDFLALLFAGGIANRIAWELHPLIWGRFRRFILVTSLLLVLLLFLDLLVRWGNVHLFPSWDVWGVPPAFSVCILLALVSLIGVWLHLLGTRSSPFAIWVEDRTQRVRYALPLTLVAIAWIGLVNHHDFKLRFPQLDYRERAPLNDQLQRAYPEISERLGSPTLVPEAAPTLVSSSEQFPAWLEVAKKAQGAKPKLVLVCTSGGASRAAYWTAVVLDRLGQELPGFHEGVRLISGASGGMVGASFYARDRFDQFEAGAVPSPFVERPREQARGYVPSDWVRLMKNNALPRVTSQIALQDLPLVFLPRLPGPPADRAIALEEYWSPRLDIAISRFREAERQGKMPSLVFSPAIVDDGRRLLISNLDLKKIALNQGAELVASVPKDPRSTPQLYSLSGIELFKVLGGNRGNELRLATAARASASFPFVSPAVNLPTDPPIRLVDAGYYDNYGVNLSVAWLVENWERMVENDEISGILLVQIRAFVGRQPRLAPPEVADGPVSSLLRGLQFFTSPVDAFTSGRETGSVFRNDEELAALMSIVNGRMGTDFFSTVVFENTSQVVIEPSSRVSTWPGAGLLEKSGRRITGPRASTNDPANTEVAMTWYVTEVEKRAMNQSIPDDETAMRTSFDELTERATTSEVPGAQPTKPNFLMRDEFRLRWLAELLELRRASQNDPSLKSYYEKQFERALNYERLQAVRDWWKAKK